MNKERGSLDSDPELNNDTEKILSREASTFFAPKRALATKLYSFAKHLPRGLRIFLSGMAAWGAVAEKAAAQTPEQPQNPSSTLADVVIEPSTLSQEFTTLPKPNPDGGLPVINVSPKLKLGFRDLTEKMAQSGFEVGEPVEEEEVHAENGDGLLHTVTKDGKTGLLVWRKADNWTAYTDGATTIINGPDGLVSRPNTERFPWEKDQPVATIAGIKATPTALEPTPTPVTLPVPEIQKEPEIIGTPEQIKAVRDAFQLLKEKDAEHYSWITNPDYTKTITFNGIGDLASNSVLAKRIDLTPASIKEGTARAASIIVHEVSESKRSADWDKAHPNAISVPDDVLYNELLYGPKPEILSITEEIKTLQRTGGDPKTIDSLQRLIEDLRTGRVKPVQPGSK